MWRLKRTTQCAHCPFRKDVDPYDIPNGYDVEKHKLLKATIAEPGSLAFVTADKVAVMACHEDHESHCVGWLWNQLGPGNNIGLRLRLMSCENAKAIRLIGEQHETFEETLPSE